VFYQGIRFAEGTIVTVGFDVKDYGGKAHNSKTSLDYGKHRLTESGLYALVQQEVLSVVTLNAGLRVNSSSTYGRALAPQVGISWRADEGMTVRASAARGFRSPTIRELYLFPAPTPDLEPEVMWNYELGFLRTLGEQISFEVTAFQAEGQNIIRTEGAYPNLKMRNSGRFVHRGLELSGSIRFSSALTSEATYGYLAPGEQTMANPRHKLYTGLCFTGGLVTANAGVQYIAGLYGADKSQKPLKDYIVAQGRVTVMPGAGFSVFVAGENLFNTSYQTMAGYPMPGRTFIGGVRWEMR